MASGLMSEGEDCPQVGNDSRYLGGGQGASGYYEPPVVANQPEQDIHRQWYVAYAGLDQKTIAVSFDLAVTLGSARIHLRKGAEGQLGPMKLRIADIRQAPDELISSWIDKKHQRAWRVAVDIESYPGSDFPSIHGYPVDEHHELINRVELSGEPIQANSDKGTQLEGLHPTPISYAQLRLASGGGTAHQVLTLVANPSKVSELELSASGKRKVTITDIPLDPKPESVQKLDPHPRGQ